MIIHQREISYRANYSEFFEMVIKLKAHMEKKYPKISVLRWPSTNESMLNWTTTRNFRSYSNLS